MSTEAGTKALAFLGLGVMGRPMASYLAANGAEVTVYNRTGAKAEAWVGEHGGRSAPTPREATQGAEAVLACVGNDDDLRACAWDRTVPLKAWQRAPCSSTTRP